MLKGTHMTQAETRYWRNPSFIYRRIVDELILVPIHQDVADMDCIYTMNPVGAFIWEQLEQPLTRAELHTALMDSYEADAATVAGDLERFLSEMTAIGAVREA